MVLPVHVTVNFHHRSGLIEDQIVQTLNFQLPTGSQSDLVALQTVVSNFYSAVHAPGLNALSTYFSNCVDRSALPFMQVYDGHLVPPLGSPIFTGGLAAVGALPAGFTPLPSEVAVVLSYHSDLTNIPEHSGNTRPRARRRGRLYFGPVHSRVLTPDSLGVPRVDTGFVDVLRGAATFLLGQGAAMSWNVWSRTDNTFRPVVQASVDNSFDTQRRRGEAPTTRTVNGLALVSHEFQPFAQLTKDSALEVSAIEGPEELS